MEIMADTLKPRDSKDVEAAVAWALAESKTLDVIGQGTKHGIGRPSQSDLTLDMSGLSGVTLYEPDELVLSARAGTPMAEIAALVDAKGQELAFEPIDYGAIFGRPLGGGTLGGALAANLSGPRRIKAGAARDHFLGLSAVSGRGETFKSGGRVVKNVTGYDLCKVLAGSFGTLAVMTDVTVKTLPKSETEETVLLTGLDDAAGVAAMTAAMGSSCDVSGAVHLPRAVAVKINSLGLAARAVTALRVEGVPPSVSHRRNALVALLKPFGAVDTLDAARSRALWQAVRDAMPFAAETDAARPLWRISTTPAQGAALGGQIVSATGAEIFYDWAGGLLWLQLDPADDVGAAAIRRATADHGGHATLIRAPAAARAAVDVFEPQDPGLAALTKRVKDSFDPKGILNPGRMWAGV